MSTLLGNIRNRITSRIRQSSASQGTSSTERQEQLDTVSTAEGCTAFQSGDDHRAEFPDGTDRDESDVNSALSNKLTSPIMINASKHHTMEEEDECPEDREGTTPTGPLSPATPVYGSLCSSDYASSYENSMTPDDSCHGLVPLRTRVMQRELLRNSPMSPNSPRNIPGHLDDDDDNYPSGEEEDTRTDDLPVTFSLREAVANSSLSAFCGKLIEIPKRRLKRNSVQLPSACVQQGVLCEHGGTCPFAFDVDGVSADFISRRRRSIQQQIDKRAQAQLQVYAAKGEETVSDFEVVCDACLQVKHCVEVPSINKQENLLICSECMLPLLSGSWYNGMDTSETVDVCSALMKKASPGVLSTGSSSGGLLPLNVSSPEVEEEEESPPTLAELAKAAPPINVAVDSEDEFEAACREVSAKRQEAMSEREAAGASALPLSDAEDVNDGAKSPTSLTASQADEKKDDVPALETPFPTRRRPSGATEKLNLPLPGTSPSNQPLSSPAMYDSSESSDFGDNLSTSTWAHSVYSQSDLAPGLLPSQIAGQESVGDIQIGLQVGVEASKQRSSFVVDIIRGYNFKLWENLEGKPDFEIYVKCYIIFPGRVVKMKTRCVEPSSHPEFLDQLISIMNKKLLQKAEQLKIQLWEDHGGLKKKLAVGVATIDLTKVKMDELVTGVYPLYVPYRGSPKPTTPTSPSVTNVSPGGTPPSLSRSGSGRFGSLRNSFKRREKLRPRTSSSGLAASSPLVSDSVLSSSAPTSSGVLSTPTRTRSHQEGDLGETDL